MSQGIKVAKEDRAVGSNAPEEFYFNTDTPLLKLANSGRDEFVVKNNATLSPVLIPLYHNLDYIPFCLVFMDRQSGKNRTLVTSEDVAIYDNTSILVSSTADRQTVTLRVDSFDGVGQPIAQGVFGYNYFIFYDKVAD